MFFFFLLYSHKTIKDTVVMGKVENSVRSYLATPIRTHGECSAALWFSLCAFWVRADYFYFYFCKCRTGVKGIIDRQNDDLKILQGRGRGKMRWKKVEDPCGREYLLVLAEIVDSSVFISAEFLCVNKSKGLQELLRNFIKSVTTLSISLLYKWILLKWKFSFSWWELIWDVKINGCNRKRYPNPNEWDLF